MVARSASVASASPILPDDIGTGRYGKTASIFAFPKTKFPPIGDVARDCAALIWATFPASSQRAVCARAANETGAASADTFARVLNGETKRPDLYLMQCVMIVAASRGVQIPPALAVRGQA